MEYTWMDTEQTRWGFGEETGVSMIKVHVCGREPEEGSTLVRLWTGWLDYAGDWINLRGV